jgi:hypothetical protein
VIGPASVLRLASDVRFRAVAPETVLVRQSVPEVMVLNEVAGAILERLAAGQPLSEIVEALASLYDAPRADLERDVLAFADELVAASVAEETVA